MFLLHLPTTPTVLSKADEYIHFDEHNQSINRRRWPVGREEGALTSTRVRCPCPFACFNMARPSLHKCLLLLLALFQVQYCQCERAEADLRDEALAKLPKPPEKMKPSELKKLLDERGACRFGLCRLDSCQLTASLTVHDALESFDTFTRVNVATLLPQSSSASRESETRAVYCRRMSSCWLCAPPRRLDACVMRAGVDCTACAEKADLVARVRETIHMPVTAGDGSGSMKSGMDAGSGGGPGGGNVDPELQRILDQLKSAPGLQNMKVRSFCRERDWACTQRGLAQFAHTGSSSFAAAKILCDSVSNSVAKL